MTANQFWLNHIKTNGVRLTVEIDLSFEEFRRLMEQSLGHSLNDDEVYSFWELVDRRILPPDQGSYSGVGFDLGECVRRDLHKEKTNE